MEKKKCLKCTKTKPLGLFGVHPSNDDGYQIWCYKCQAKYQEDYYVSHYEIIADKRKAKRALKAKILLRVKALNPCRCGEDEPLVLTILPLRPDVPKPDLTNTVKFRTALSGSAVVCGNCRIKIDAGLLEAPEVPLKWDPASLEPPAPRARKEKEPPRRPALPPGVQ